MSTWIHAAVSAAALGCVAPFASASTDVQVPLFVQPLAGPITLTVTASDIQDFGDEMRILQAGVDITSMVVTGSNLVTADDANNDGIYENYANRYTVDVQSLDFSHPQITVVVTTLDPLGNPSSVSRSIGIIPPAQVGIPNASWVTAVDGTEARFYLHLRGGKLLSKSITVYKNGQDVTAQAMMQERVVWDSTRQGFITDRMYEIKLDLASISFGLLGDKILIKIDLTWLNAFMSIFSPPVEEVDPNPEAAKRACVTSCLQTFISAIGAAQSAGGQVTIGASHDDVASACDNLKACLDACGFTSPPMLVGVPGFGSVIVGIGSASGAADLVVAVGSDGSTGMTGGAATATNTQTGGAAVAHGGDGGTGQSGGGPATATSNGGDAVAQGGNGGAGATGGGTGGDGTATNTVSGKTAKAKGGNGGAPSGSSNGGSGGNGKATAGSSKVEMAGGKGGGSTAGTGGIAQMSGGSPNGSHEGQPQ